MNKTTIRDSVKKKRDILTREEFNMFNQFVVFDIDGTVAKVGDRIKYIDGTTKKKDYKKFYQGCTEDKPIQPLIDMAQTFFIRGYIIIFITGRMEYVREETEAWIKKHFNYGFKYQHLFMRDSNDTRPDTETKPELMERLFELEGIEPSKIKFIFEDRSSMVKKWRELGFTCFQVADGDF